MFAQRLKPRRRPRVAPLAAAGLALGSAACSVGDGTGDVSGDVHIEDCWDGFYDLRPTFFGANPYDDDLAIRIQRGEEPTLVSDGIALLVRDISEVREQRLGQPLSLGLPPGVAPSGYPLPDIPAAVDASLTLYLNFTCRGENATVSAVEGSLYFDELFSGDPNEDSAAARRTHGWFDAKLIDPRQATPNPDAAPGEPSYRFPEELMSELSGEFWFVFHRGTPAQPFP